MGFVASSTYNFTYGEFLVDHKKIKQDIDDFEKDLKVLRDSLLVIGAIDYSKDRVQNSYDENRLLDKSFTLAQSYKDIEYLKARYSAFMRFFPYSILPTVMPQREALMIRKYFMEGKPYSKVARYFGVTEATVMEVCNAYRDKYENYEPKGLVRLPT